MIRPLFRCLLLYFCLTQFSRGAVWQFASDLPAPAKGRAFLWIPPDCPQLRGIILAQQTILEKTALEDPVIRSAATAGNLGIVIFCPPAFSGNDFTAAGTGRKTLDSILASLAATSGYSELKTAPFLTLGHSGGAIFAWHAAYAQPERCLGVIGLHAHPIPPPADQPTLLLEGVPVLTISGQYETWGQQGKSAESHWQECRDKSLAFRRRSPKCLMSVLVQPSTTHFNWDPALARYTADFIAKTTQLRLPSPDTAPSTNPPLLREIPPNSGWLTSPALIDLPEFPAAAAADYKGPPTETFWHPDKETATANESFCRSARGKLPQFLSLQHNGQLLPCGWLPKLSLPTGPDGSTITVNAAFHAKVPPEVAFPNRPGSVSHSTAPIQFRLIGGWSGGGRQTGDATFQPATDRFGITHPSPSLMVMAHHPGDARFAPAQQPAEITLPPLPAEAKPQKITFPPLPSIPSSTRTITLKASSSAGLPPAFCVIAGPAEINGNQLSLTKIPPKTPFPIRITIAAYHPGSHSAPFIQPAAPVEQTLLLSR